MMSQPAARLQVSGRREAALARIITRFAARVPAAHSSSRLRVFDKLSSRLSAVVGGLTGRGRLTEENIADTLRQVRMALLEADVALPVVRELIDSVKTRAIGLEVHKSLTPGQALVRVIHEELVRVMGEGARGPNLRVQPPAVILLAGLQGAGKHDDRSQACTVVA
jgi:signal recognition particle GTPase